MPYYLAPLANEQQVDANGSPVSGGKLWTYIAGTSTPATTYTDDTGATQQANPIILNSLGVPASPVWLQGGRTYKLVFQDANGVQTRPTIDDVTGINDPAVASTSDQWVVYANAPTYISATSFSVAGDQKPTFQVGRRLRSTNTGGTIYSTILTATFADGITTITVANDSGTLDSGLSAVSYGLISVANTSLPTGPAFSAYQSTLQAVATATFTKLQFQTEEFDTASGFDTANGRFTPKVAGYYAINAGVSYAAAVAPAICSIYKNGSEYKRGHHANSSTIGSTVQCLVYLNGSTDYVEAYAYQGSGGSVNTSADSKMTYFQGVRLA